MMSLGLVLGVAHTRPPRPVPASFTLLSTVAVSTLSPISPPEAWAGGAPDGGPFSVVARGSGILVYSSTLWHRPVDLALAATAAGARFTGTADNNYDPANPLRMNHEALGVWVNPADDTLHAFIDSDASYYRFQTLAGGEALQRKTYTNAGRGIIGMGQRLFCFDTVGDASTFSNVVRNYGPPLSDTTALSEGTRVQFPEDFVGQERYQGPLTILDGRWCACTNGADPPDLEILTKGGTAGTTVTRTFTGASGAATSILYHGGFMFLTTDSADIYKFQVNY